MTNDSKSGLDRLREIADALDDAERTSAIALIQRQTESLRDRSSNMNVKTRPKSQNSQSSVVLVDAEQSN